TINVSALAITFLGILFFNVKAPFTVLQLLWINVIMDTFASIALCSEPPRPGVMRLPPKKRDENIVTPIMLWTIAVTAGFFLVVMLGLLVVMQRGFQGEGESVGGFTIRQGTLFFSIYVFFQIWNQINCRSLTPGHSGLHRILRNPTFLVIAGLTAIGQMVIVTFGGRVFNVEPLSVGDWLGVIGLTSSILIFAEIVRRIRAARRGLNHG
ncbi:MAG TPA: cation transporting ATPase C-terminal domain-containing protein, partial [Gemmataceae bacterium]|nr:cation transporting ATPase C-terminal domain-containing protein [Gemmataceae bacterium]